MPNILEDGGFRSGTQLPKWISYCVLFFVLQQLFLDHMVNTCYCCSHCWSRVSFLFVLSASIFLPWSVLSWKPWNLWPNPHPSQWIVSASDETEEQGILGLVLWLKYICLFSYTCCLQLASSCIRHSLFNSVCVIVIVYVTGAKWCLYVKLCIPYAFIPCVDNSCLLKYDISVYKTEDWSKILNNEHSLYAGTAIYLNNWIKSYLIHFFGFGFIFYANYLLLCKLWMPWIFENFYFVIFF